MCVCNGSITYVSICACVSVCMYICMCVSKVYSGFWVLWLENHRWDWSTFISFCSLFILAFRNCSVSCLIWYRARRLALAAACKKCHGGDEYLLWSWWYHGLLDTHKPIFSEEVLLWMVGRMRTGTDGGQDQGQILPRSIKAFFL